MDRRTLITILAVRTLGNAIVLTSIMIIVGFFWPVMLTEVGYRLRTASSAARASAQDAGPFAPLFAQLKPFTATPADPTFSLIIEKIGANSKVIANVDPNNEKAYLEALKLGVAHAAGTALPGDRGNMYLFAHSTDAPINISRYNAVFYLLRELVPGDRVVVVANGWRYDYVVTGKHIAEPSDIHWLTEKTAEPVLTLQTCWPPGTTLKRLIVRASLEGATKYTLPEKTI